MRVTPKELEQMRNKVSRTGVRYDDLDLGGAAQDVDYALFEGGFTLLKTEDTGEPECMVLYTCIPKWSPADAQEIVQRLEDAWVRDGAFSHEEHSIIVREDEGVVALKFVTWWDHGAFYTGRIEVVLSNG